MQRSRSCQSEFYNSRINFAKLLKIMSIMWFLSFSVVWKEISQKLFSLIVLFGAVWVLFEFSSMMIFVFCSNLFLRFKACCLLIDTKLFIWTAYVCHQTLLKALEYRLHIYMFLGIILFGMEDALLPLFPLSFYILFSILNFSFSKKFIFSGRVSVHANVVLTLFLLPQASCPNIISFHSHWMFSLFCMLNFLVESWRVLTANFLLCLTDCIKLRRLWECPEFQSHNTWYYLCIFLIKIR